jgi:hypothetical protein
MLVAVISPRDGVATHVPMHLRITPNREVQNYNNNQLILNIAKFPGPHPLDLAIPRKDGD